MSAFSSSVTPQRLADMKSGPGDKRFRLKRLVYMGMGDHDETASNSDTR